MNWFWVAVIVIAVMVNSYFWYLKGYKDGVLESNKFEIESVKERMKRIEKEKYHIEKNRRKY